MHVVVVRRVFHRDAIQFQFVPHAQIVDEVEVDGGGRGSTQRRTTPINTLRVRQVRVTFWVALAVSAVPFQSSSPV